MTVLTIPEIIDGYNAMRARADSYQRMVHWRAVQEYHRAFGNEAKRGDTLNWCIVHNSLIGHWREVNRHHMRKCQWLLERRQHLARRICDAWYSRQMDAWREAGRPVTSERAQ